MSIAPPCWSAAGEGGRIPSIIPESMTTSSRWLKISRFCRTNRSPGTIRSPLPFSIPGKSSRWSGDKLFERTMQQGRKEIFLQEEQIIDLVSIILGHLELESRQGW